MPATKIEQLGDALLSSDDDYWKCDNCGAINRADKHDTVCPYCDHARIAAICEPVKS